MHEGFTGEQSDTWEYIKEWAMRIAFPQAEEISGSHYQHGMLFAAVSTTLLYLPSIPLYLPSTPLYLPSTPLY